MYSNPRALDPRIGEAEDKNTILKMLFEGLTRIDQRGQVALGVAQSVEISRARNSYTFHLRSTCWSNGSPVTAHDFEYAWKTVLSPQFKTPFAYLFYPIQNAQDVKEGRLHPDLLGVHVINEKTLQVKLRNPIPYFLELIALPQFFPVHQEVDLTEPSWPTQEGERYVCNGAFVLKTNHSFRGYELIKNPSYYEAKKIRLDSITIQKVHISEIHEMLLHNQIDWAGFPMGFIKFPLLPRSVGDPIILPNELLHWYIFNTQRFPFNCTKLRQSFSLVINRMRILHHLSPGSCPGFTILPLHQTRASLMEEHRDKGVQLFHEALKELNLTQKTFPHLKILYTEGDTRRTIASTIKEEWEETLGIRCSIEAFEWRSFMEKINDGDFQIGAMDWISLINDPSYTLEIFRKSNPLINFPKWHHPRYESLLDKAFRAIQPQKRLLYYALAEEILLREAPVIPILRTLPQSIKKNHVQMPHNSPMKAWDLKWLTVRNH